MRCVLLLRFSRSAKAWHRSFVAFETCFSLPLQTSCSAATALFWTMQVPVILRDVRMSSIPPETSQAWRDRLWRGQAATDNRFSQKQHLISCWGCRSVHNRDRRVDDSRRRASCPTWCVTSRAADWRCALSCHICTSGSCCWRQSIESCTSLSGTSGPLTGSRSAENFPQAVSPAPVRIWHLGERLFNEGLPENT